ncbi:MAG: hypothetical protein K6L76_05130 [Agarilytica sp.]
MKSEGAPSKAVQFPILGASSPGDAYSSIVSRLEKSPCRPLRLIVNFQPFSDLSQDSIQLIDFMKQEIKAWASVLGQRTIDSMWVFHPFQHIATFELTRLLHIIASQFHIPEDQEKKFAVITHTEDINTSHLALSKGLGFSHFQIVVNQECSDSLKQLHEKIGLLRQYNVDSIGIQLQNTDCLNEARDAIKKLQHHCEPDYFCLSNHQNGFELILDNGTDFGGELQKDDIDVLALGPEAKSSVGDIHLQNFCSSKKYQNSLEAQKLPIYPHL